MQTTLVTIIFMIFFFRKTKTSTLQFILGACFFVYLPCLPIILLLCSWKRKHYAKKRLLRNAERKKLRIIQKKRAGELNVKKNVSNQEMR